MPVGMRRQRPPRRPALRPTRRSSKVGSPSSPILTRSVASSQRTLPSVRRRPDGRRERPTSTHGVPRSTLPTGRAMRGDARTRGTASPKRCSLPAPRGVTRLRHWPMPLTGPTRWARSHSSAGSKRWRGVRASTSRLPTSERLAPTQLRRRRPPPMGMASRPGSARSSRSSSRVTRTSGSRTSCSSARARPGSTSRTSSASSGSASRTEAATVAARLGLVE